MRVFITGATGFIGRALIAVLRRDGHSVVVWARSETRAKQRLGAEVEVVATDADAATLSRALAACDGVVNLAGEPLMGGRWTPARRAVLRQSRVDVTERLVAAMAAASPRPRVLISGSAVGYYGDRADERLPEEAAPGDDFLARLCRDWEAAARGAETLGVRVIRLRTGVVLGRDGGALAQMLPPFRLGVGGPIGNGRQYLSWIHLHDLVKIIAVALVDERYHGPINGVAPEEATSRTFGKALGRALHRPAILPTPAFVLRLLFGEAASVLLGSQRVDPLALRERGFVYEFPRLDAALANIVGGAHVAIGPLSSPPAPPERDSRDYLEGHRPTHQLRTTTMVNAPLEQVFAFFSKAANLGMLTPASMRFSMDGPAPAIERGVTIDYQLRVGPVPIRWQTLIASWEPGRRFVDVQQRGPYRMWWHQHTFRADGARTVMEDCVYYTPPLGVAGRLANAAFIAPALRRVFQYRGDVIHLRFGAS